MPKVRVILARSGVAMTATYALQEPYRVEHTYPHDYYMVVPEDEDLVALQSRIETWGKQMGLTLKMEVTS